MSLQDRNLFLCGCGCRLCSIISKHRPNAAIYNSQLFFLWMFTFKTMDMNFWSAVGSWLECGPERNPFIYGMDGSKVLLQIPTPVHGIASYARMVGLSQGMLPICLRIGGFSVCSPGILSVLAAWAVHEQGGNQISGVFFCRTLFFTGTGVFILRKLAQRGYLSHEGS